MFYSFHAEFNKIYRKAPAPTHKKLFKIRNGIYFLNCETRGLGSASLLQEDASGQNSSGGQAHQGEVPGRFIVLQGVY